MEIEKIDFNFSVCKVKDYSLVDVEQEFCFIGGTDEEKSLVCIMENYSKVIKVLSDAGYHIVKDLCRNFK